MTRALPLVVLATACAHREPPPLTTVHLAGAAVTYRPWGGPRVCEAEPRFLLDELTAVNSGLQRWLKRAGGDAPSEWSESRIAEVEAWAATLDQLVREHTVDLESLARCDFADAPGYAYVRKRGAELLGAVERRRQELGRLYERARAVRQRDAWERGINAERSAARRECPSRSPQPRVFFAWRDDEGVTRWLFCDGVSVEQTPQGSPVLLEPETRGRQRFTEAQYLDAVRSYPAARVSAAPAPPPA
ncbi:MAG: hypothetical protein JNK82_06530 [Myxococcaceae bacterium]|nr:hypothetical protein [Myxococcaceae bacterium]